MTPPIATDFETAALLWCLLWPDDAADVVTTGWFHRPAYREAYDALATSMTLHEALTRATPRAAFLIRRLIP